MTEAPSFFYAKTFLLVTPFPLTSLRKTMDTRTGCLTPSKHLKLWGRHSFFRATQASGEDDGPGLLPQRERGILLEGCSANWQWAWEKKGWSWCSHGNEMRKFWVTLSIWNWIIADIEDRELLFPPIFLFTKKKKNNYKKEDLTRFNIFHLKQ